MISLSFVLLVVLLFTALFAYETNNDSSQPRLKQFGLFTWLISGNWPAKVGAGLVIVGVGALLRYALLNIDVPPEIKLGSGVLISAALGAIAMMLKNQPDRRAVHLAFAGAAFGVAYLTGYGAYGFFNYINDVNALALLALVAIAAGMFAVTSNAMSVAILAMVGAYIAPKFAIGTPGVLPVYGYYLVASILSMVMVSMRGWRPLIHLSFLFTLAGGIFFAWSGKFYQAEHYIVMQPLLLALTGVHLAMPLLERRHIRSTWLARFDTGYFILLPIVAAILTLKIAPTLKMEGAIGLGALASIWAGASVILSILKKNGAFHHVLIAALLTIGAVLCTATDIPWLLVLLGFSVAIFAISPKLGWSRSAQEMTCGAMMVIFIFNVLNSVIQPTPTNPFFNEIFAYRGISCAMLALGAWLGIQRSMSFAKILGTTAAGWAVLSIVAEVWRLNIDFLPQLIYGTILGVIMLSVLFSNRISTHPVVGGFLIFALVSCGWWTADGTSSPTTLIYLMLTPVGLIGMMWAGRDSTREEISDFSPSIALGLLPFAVLPWARATGGFAGIETNYFELTLALAAAAVAGLSARLWLRESPRWNTRIQPLHFYIIALILLYSTLFHIERNLFAAAFEVGALSYLIGYLLRRSRESSPPSIITGALAVLSVALVLQAMLLRAFGPDGTLNASDINRMQLPAVVSLMWAIFGASLTWWGTRVKSRVTWSAGAVLLIVAAVKLVFFDMGTLGQLGNILAFIGAGLVFLAVAYFAPIPSKTTSSTKSDRRPSFQATSDLASTQRAQQSKSSPANQKNRANPSPGYLHEKEPAIATPLKNIPKSANGSARYRQEPPGINGLWFLLVGLAIAIAFSSLAFRDYVKQKRRFQQSRERAMEARLQASQDIPGSPAPISYPPAAPSPETSTALTEPALTEPGHSNRSLAPEPAAQPVKIMDACQNFTAQLPADYVLYAGGAYKGHIRDTQLRQSREPGHFDVFVNAPGKNVVLALGSYEPADWNIQRGASTKIVGVFVSGYHAQTISSMPSGVPLLNATYDSKSPCGYFYVTRDNANQADASIRKIFGRSAQTYFLATDGRIDFGNPPSSASTSQDTDTKIERYVDDSGNVGYRQAFEKQE